MDDGIARIEREVILPGRRDNRAWFEPGMAVVPARADRPQEVFVVAKMLTGNDIGPLVFLRTQDKGQNWTPAAISRGWHKVPLADHIFEEPWFVPCYHRQTDQLIAIGNTHFVVDAGGEKGQKNEMHIRRPDLVPGPVYSLWNPKRCDFEPWERLAMPEGIKLGLYYAGQKHECADGTIFVPGYYYAGPDKQGSSEYKAVTVLRLAFDGTRLEFLDHGSVHVIEADRGLAEPSMIRFADEYFLTVRHDQRGYVTRSPDGLHYQALQPWTFDDGSDLGNYNTQQHWLRHGRRLYLVYNRKSKLNNGVFRSRAPLFMAQVDPERLCVLRDTERVVFPEQGARMGNFCMADIAANESWIVTGEWLEGSFPHSQPGDRFFIDSPTINYMQYIGDLLLARVLWQDEA